MDIALDILRELTQDDRMLWVAGSGPVVSENDSKGIHPPEVHGRYVTIEADNWHCHLDLDVVTGIQFVEAVAHGDLLSYYVRFSGAQEDTLLRSYFPIPTSTTTSTALSSNRIGCKPLKTSETATLAAMALYSSNAPFNPPHRPSHCCLFGVELPRQDQPTRFQEQASAAVPPLCRHGQSPIPLQAPRFRLSKQRGLRRPSLHLGLRPPRRRA